MKRRFVKDDDGHWYLIPYNKTREFEHWVWGNAEGFDWSGADFDDMRCNDPSNYIIEVLNNEKFG